MIYLLFHTLHVRALSRAFFRNVTLYYYDFETLSFILFPNRYMSSYVNWPTTWMNLKRRNEVCFGNKIIT
jgi:hypothetical protein